MKKQYRISSPWIGCSGGLYWRVQQKGMFGIWWTMASVKLEKAKELLKELQEQS